MIMDLSELLGQFLKAELHIGALDDPVAGDRRQRVRPGQRHPRHARRVAAWPIGIVGNILLFTVFLGGVFDTPSDLNLYGQAGRQVFFLIVSVYGWVRW